MGNFWAFLFPFFSPLMFVFTCELIVTVKQPLTCCCWKAACWWSLSFCWFSFSRLGPIQLLEDICRSCCYIRDTPDIIINAWIGKLFWLFFTSLIKLFGQTMASSSLSTYLFRSILEEIAAEVSHISCAMPKYFTVYNRSNYSLQFSLLFPNYTCTIMTNQTTSYVVRNTFPAF